MKKCGVPVAGHVVGEVDRRRSRLGFLPVWPRSPVRRGRSPCRTIRSASSRWPVARGPLRLERCWLRRGAWHSAKSASWTRPEARVALLRARASSATSAAGSARGWKGRGLCFHTMPHLVAVRRAHLLERGLHPPAEGALEVGELHDGHERRGLAAHGRLADRDAVRRVRSSAWAALGAEGFGAVHCSRLSSAYTRAGGVPRPIVAAAFSSCSSIDGREFLVRLRAGDEHAVDEERGRAGHAELLAERHVGVDLASPPAGRPRPRPAARPARFATSAIRSDEAARVGEERVVRAPEAVVAEAVEDGHRDHGRRLRVRVEGQGVVLPHDAELVGPVHAPQIRQRRRPPWRRTGTGTRRTRRWSPARPSGPARGPPA